MDKKFLEGLTEEQKEALKKCRTKEELMALISEENVTLSMEQMELVSGGCSCEHCCNLPR